jgi:hypothetical protein
VPATQKINRSLSLQSHLNACGGIFSKYLSNG